MSFEVVLTGRAETLLSDHLLQHYRLDVPQEDLCFALWRPSTGQRRLTALIDEVILPGEDERTLHGNASFQPSYVGRAIQLARQRGAGLAFMHSHPGSGWQDMSAADVEAERDVLAYPSGATGLPLVGLTIGKDGCWSARFWDRQGRSMRRSWCEKVRVVGPQSYRFFFNDGLVAAPSRRNVLRRTFDTWGRHSQETISRLRVGIVGLGSVGSVVAEAMARIGVSRVSLIDPDRIEEHNLDRLVYGTTRDVGKLKVDVAAQSMRRHSASERIRIATFPYSVHEHAAYEAALDCDVIFSCVDKPVARDVLNYIAQAHLIPVIDGGVEVETDPGTGKFFSAHWRAHLATPYHQCLRCNGQYSSGSVVTELDGSLEDPSYVKNLPLEARGRNQNVFPFSLSVAGMEVNLMLRYLLGDDWWPVVNQQDSQFITGETRVINKDCQPHCSFRPRRARGDAERPFYLTDTGGGRRESAWQRPWGHAVRLFGKIFPST